MKRNGALAEFIEQTAQEKNGATVQEEFATRVLSRIAQLELTHLAEDTVKCVDSCKLNLTPFPKVQHSCC
ncbi:MAG: hypothetical protein R3E08_06270 [Thiotrichaceae bacterium]